MRLSVNLLLRTTDELQGARHEGHGNVTLFARSGRMHSSQKML